MTDLRQWLMEQIAARAGIRPEEVDPGRTFRDYGLSSRDAVTISGLLEELLDTNVAQDTLWRYPTVDALVEHFAPPPEAAAKPREAEAAPVAPRGEADPIAIVGIGCRFPGGANSPSEFWQLLSSGRDAVGPVPNGRWEAYRGRSPQTAALVDAVPQHGGFLEDVHGFDTEFFGIVPAEAQAMDPQQRIVLEVVWEALEHAGIPADSLAGSRTGVFIGSCGDDYGRQGLEDIPGLGVYSATGASPSIIANRLSYVLDLRGPSMTVDTACSSSLVSAHLAARALAAGECDLALVGGVNLLLSPAASISFNQAGLLSADGRCKAFSSRADGIVRGEGCGVVVLRRLSDARAAGDRVLALLSGSAVAQDGRSNGLMAPNPGAQSDLLEAAWADSSITARQVTYLEAHGTGTALGDPMEAEAIHALRGAKDPSAAPLPIGSVKTNLGHLEGAAGIAGLIKTTLALHHGKIPPTLHCAEPAKDIASGSLGVRVVTATEDWPAPSGARYAGVSSFGFGGTIAHVVLQDATDPAAA